MRDNLFLPPQARWRISQTQTGDPEVSAHDLIPYPPQIGNIVGREKYGIDSAHGFYDVNHIHENDVEIDDEKSGENDFDIDEEKDNEKDEEGDLDKDYEADGSEANPIVYHYLTFKTPLPQPSHLSTSAPDCPDLNPYIDPFEWSEARKTTLTWLSCFATISAAYAAGSVEGAFPQIEAKWHISDVAASVSITVFTVGFGVAPMILAPFSEINGRRPVFLVTGFLYFVFVLVCAVTPTFAGMVVARFLAGCASSTFSTMVGGVVADIYHAADRNTPMTLFTGSALFGTGLGPLVSGFIGQNADWRWVFYVHTIFVGILFVFIVLLFKETRGSVILSRKAKALNKWYQAREDAGFYGFDMPADGSCNSQTQRIRWKVKADEERTSLKTMIATSLYRPFHLLFTEPVVFFFSLWISFSWAILYMMFSIVPYVFSTVYLFTLQQTGAVFASISIASIIATILNIGQERIAQSRGKLTNTPEGRLYFCCFESALLPIGLFMFGWTSSASIPWIVPAIAVGCATIGIFSIYLAVFNYLADSYHRYASSAIAAQSFCRNMLGGAFPLFTKQLFLRMGYGFGGAASFLGAVGVGLTLVPWVLVFWGKRIRARSKIASELLAD